MIGTGAMAQTKKIAHRSHSGQDMTLNYDGDDNFGLPAREYRDSMYRQKQVDTAKKVPIIIDSIKPKKTKPPFDKRSKRPKAMLAVLPKKIKVGA